MSAAIDIYDVLIAGSGPAGLAGALGLSRLHRTVAIFTKTKGAGFRNEGVTEMHNVLRSDGADPLEFRRISVEQIRAYGTTSFFEADLVALRPTTLTFNERDIPGFEAEDATKRIWRGRKLVLAMGSVEMLPAIEGYAENWPHNIYQCLYCDGHERSHLPGGVLGFETPMSAHAAQMANMLRTETSGPVTVFTNGVPTDADGMASSFEIVAALGCRVETAKIVRLVPSGDVGVNVVLENGKNIYVGWLIDKPDTKLAGKEMIERLGIEYTSQPPLGEYLKMADAFGSTNVKGVFAAGDCTTFMKAVANAIASGAIAAGGIIQQLIAEDTAFAVEIYKNSTP